MPLYKLLGKAQGLGSTQKARADLTPSFITHAHTRQLFCGWGLLTDSNSWVLLVQAMDSLANSTAPCFANDTCPDNHTECFTRENSKCGVSNRLV